VGFGLQESAMAGCDVARSWDENLTALVSALPTIGVPHPCCFSAPKSKRENIYRASAKGNFRVRVDEWNAGSTPQT